MSWATDTKVQIIFIFNFPPLMNDAEIILFMK